MKLAKNPAAAYQQGKQQGQTEGVQNGFTAFSVASIVAINNIDYFKDKAEFAKFFSLYEKELERILVEECHSNPAEAAEMLTYYADQHREELGLEGRFADLK